MSATTMTRVDALAKLKDLQAKAEQMEQSHNEQLGQIMAEIRDTANIASGAYQVHEGNGKSKSSPVTASTTATTATKKRGRPKGSKNVVAAKPTSTPKKRGRPKGSKNVVAAKPTPKKRGRPAAKDDKPDKPLKEVVWEVLSRGPKKWKEQLPDLPKGVKGLKAADIAIIIRKEKLWKDSPTAPGQIANHIGNLKKEAKLERLDDARYAIVKGAKLED